ncbi:hypothetical protein [Bradyrhizobium ottawaense]|uniref:hypothetical protein n=1 Tax=Bradyrhizobium ottawaense TaxID=931866 RepID=UPI0030C77EA8
MANLPKIAVVAPYVDTIELSSTRRFHPALIRALKANSGSAFPKMHKDQNNPKLIWRYTLIVNQPSRFCIALLQLYTEVDCNFSLYRLHLAFDVIRTHDGWTYEGVTEVLKNLLHLRYRKHTDSIYEYEGTTYSISVARRKSRPYRNLCFYNSKPSNITGEDNCIHVEIRMERKRTVQAAGILAPSDILSIKPKEVFEKFAVVKDHRRALEEITLRGVALTSRAYPDECPSVLERRLRALNKRIGLHWISIYARHYPDSFDRLEKWDCLDVEEELNWASVDIACASEVRELRSLLPTHAYPPAKRHAAAVRERL